MSTSNGEYAVNSRVGSRETLQYFPMNIFKLHAVDGNDRRNLFHTFQLSDLHGDKHSFSRIMYIFNFGMCLFLLIFCLTANSGEINKTILADKIGKPFPHIRNQYISDVSEVTTTCKSGISSSGC